MSKKHNFTAGPCQLPEPVLQQAQKAIADFAGTGVSVLCISHRTPQWQALMDETRALWRELLGIPEDYEILFLHGGASAQFLSVPVNLLERKAAYLDTGVWSSKAIKEAEAYGEVEVVASSKEDGYNSIPRGFTIPADADYFHITTNNTIYGTEIHTDIESPVPLVADMSSDILSRPLDVSRYALIYGGAQKNAGPAGVGFVIVRKDILGKVTRHIPSMLNLALHAEKESMFNTPPVFSIYVMNRFLAWTKEQGGVEAMYRLNTAKAEALYSEIERNSMFLATARKEDRSIMNVRFVMAPGKEALENDFLAFCEAKDIVGIKGHRLVGGFRASIYNACTMEDVQALVACMREFEKLHS